MTNSPSPGRPKPASATTALVGAPSTKAIAKAFEPKYGIPVHVPEARASELRECTRTEPSAGRYLGDVMFNRSTVMFFAVGMTFAVLDGMFSH